MKTDFHIGNQTAAAAGWPLEPFEFALANGFDAFEFFPDRGHGGGGGWDEWQFDESQRADLRRRAEQQGLRLSVHAPLSFNPLHDPESDRLYSSVSFAAAIGARLLNLHLDAGQGSHRFLEALKPALRLTAEAGLQLALENTVWTSPEDFNHFFEELYNSGLEPVDHVGMCVDLGHANVCEATRHDYLDFMDRVRRFVPVIHLHLHENWGDRDSHLTVFTGPSATNSAGLAGFLDRLIARGFTGSGILEQWPQPPALLAEARRRLMNLFESRLRSAKLAAR